MEYALDGYGYSVVRVLRDMLRHRQSDGEKVNDSWAEALLRAIESGRSEDIIVKSLSRLLLGDEQPAFEQPPELLSTLRSLGHHGPLNGLALRVASAAKIAFDVFQHTLKPRIAVCSIEKGDRGDEHMLLGMYSPTLTADVRVGDSVAAGVLVALHGEPGGGGCRLEVLPRMYRKVCQNGAIVFLEDARSHELHLHRHLLSEAVEPLAHVLEQMIRACFDATVLEPAVDSFQRSANEPLGDGGLAESLVSGLSPGVMQAVLNRYRTEGDFTRWGLLNAVTAEARTAPSGLLLQLERLGGELARQSVAMRVHTPGNASLPYSKKLTAA
ncbi:hypothetical protein [Vitiosangium sp. GDMCC 1.1324]|uniref:hypothetical protein n=1 Tax=Vitiosangium sp. (strain GDMCC 1.1324) TaxID=2138576 RepID=UPI000D39217D|nr:hypothetical protein [Vitiosangium sp. GDMCC 1.1324]PTL76543.1 hypothetical protein DAT35_48895 [Vitiosangium sp. GDMCC 1.1324]